MARIRLVPLVASAVLGLATSSCSLCTKVPEARRYFDPTRPEWALVGFIYAVETEQFDHACWSVSRATRERFGCLELRFGLWVAEDPRTGIALIDLIVGSAGERWVAPPEPDSIATIAFLSYEGEDESGRSVAYETKVYLVREPDEETGEPFWKLDLLRTLEDITGYSLDDAA